MLQPGVKYPEIRLGITAGRCCPLPVAVIEAGIIISQMLGKITFAPTPVDMQVLDQKGGNYHSQSIVHKAGGVQFTYTGIDDRKTGFTLAPGLKIIGVVIPV